MDYDLARLVSEHLDYLFDDWNQDIDEPSIRRNSVVLRSLLIDEGGQLNLLAKQMKKVLRVMTPASTKLMNETELRKLHFFQLGGAKQDQTIVESFSSHKSSRTEQERLDSYKKTREVMGKSFPIGIKPFLKQTSFAFDGVLVNREEVIKYVTNKLGGVHYDPRRKVDDALDQKYALLDELKGWQMGGKNGVYYEILSVGQRLINSRDIRRLRKELKQILALPPIIYASA